MEMTNGHKAGWSRLQRVSCAHAMALAGSKPFRNNRRGSIGVPEVIRENVEILGRGTEADVKTRLHWYTVFHPEILNAS